MAPTAQNPQSASPWAKRQGRPWRVALCLSLAITGAGAWALPSAAQAPEGGSGEVRTGPWGEGQHPSFPPQTSPGWDRWSPGAAEPSPVASPSPWMQLAPSPRALPLATPRPQPRASGTPRPWPSYRPAPSAAPPTPRPATPSPRPPVLGRPYGSTRASFPVAWPWHPAKAPVLGRHGAVSCVSADATRVGLEALKRGGNAVDAAVAMAMALAVVYPEAGNLGGGGFALIRRPGGDAYALDFREVAPARATARMYLDVSGNATDRSRIGRLAAGVPGTPAGLEAMHKRFGRRGWAEAVAPAENLARNGFVVNAYLAESIAKAQDVLLRFPATRAAFLPGGHPPKAGDRLVQAELAVTLNRLRSQGARGFYQGGVAQAIAADQRAHGGLISTADLANYRPVWRQPLSSSYRGRKLLLFPPPSSGGIIMAQLFNMLAHDDLPTLGWQSPAHLHLMAELERRAFADRNAYLGDPDQVGNLPIAKLMDPAYALRRRAEVQPRRATPNAGRQGGLGPEHTTHLSVVDAAGMAVSLTYTLNGNYGSGVVVPGTGVLLNNEMDDFAVKPGAPNLFGLVQGAQNAVAPNKRPLSSMSPTLVIGTDGQLEMALGAPGGSTIPTTVAQVISHVLDFGIPLNEAVAAPRYHHQDLPDLLYVEPGAVDQAKRTALVGLGHQVERRAWIGDVHAIRRRRDGVLEAVADPRRAGTAGAY